MHYDGQGKPADDPPVQLWNPGWAGFSQPVSGNPLDAYRRILQSSGYRRPTNQESQDQQSKTQ